MIRLYLGKSAAGKDTRAKKDIENGLTPIISYTTRPMRDGETDGVDYNFVSEETFLKMIKQHEKHLKDDPLTEWRSYRTLDKNNQPAIWYYGTPNLDPNKDYVGVVELSGAHGYLTTYGSDQIELIYLDVPDDVRKQRAMFRGSFNEAEWNRRLKADTADFSKDAIYALSMHYGRPITVEHYDPAKEEKPETEEELSLS